MKWFNKAKRWIKKETWWRLHYKRVNLTDREACNGRCLVCHAGTPGTDHIRCSKSEGRDCPCKYNQCLKFKKDFQS